MTWRRWTVLAIIGAAIVLAVMAPALTAGPGPRPGETPTPYPTPPVTVR